MSSLESEQQFCLKLVGLVGQFKAALAMVAETHGLTAIQLGALHKISQGDETMGQVAHSLHCDASNVTGIVDRLHSLGLVSRVEGRHDRRVKTLALTPTGEAVMYSVTGQLPQHLGCKRLSSNEQHELLRLLDKMISTTQ